MQTTQTILATLVPLLIVALGTLALVLYLWRAGKTGKANLADKLWALANIKDQLIAAAPEIVATMEAKWGKGSGPVKLAGAIFKLLEIIPAEYTPDFNGAALTDIVEDALAATRPLWEANPGMVKPESNAGEPLDAEPLRLIAAKDIAAGETVELVTAFAAVGGDGAADGEVPAEYTAEDNAPEEYTSEEE